MNKIVNFNKQELTQLLYALNLARQLYQFDINEGFARKDEDEICCFLSKYFQQQLEEVQTDKKF